MQPLPSPAGPSEAPPPGRAAVASSVAVRTPLWQEVLILPTDRAANPRHELWHAKAVEGECCFVRAAARQHPGGCQSSDRARRDRAPSCPRVRACARASGRWARSATACGMVPRAFFVAPSLRAEWADGCSSARCR